jgi:hypothetical protein
VATPTHRALLTKFAQEHFGTEVEFVPERTFGKKFVAGRFRSKAADQQESQEEVATQKLETPAR